MDLNAKKTMLRKMPHGIYVVGVKRGEEVNAFTATWLTQASFTPPLVALGVKRDSTSFGMLREGQVFSVNFLGKQQKALAEHFVKPVHVVGDKLGEIRYRPGKTGAPLLEEAIGFVECEVREITNERGDHAIVIGEVVEAGINRDEPTLALIDTGWHYGG